VKFNNEVYLQDLGCSRGSSGVPLIHICITNILVLYQTRKTPDVPMSFAYSYVANVCGLKRVGSRIAREGVQASIMQMRQSCYCMELEWTGVCTHVSKATTSSNQIKSNQIRLLRILTVLNQLHTQFYSDYRRRH
jgi:hypothetical protein